MNKIVEHYYNSTVEAERSRLDRHFLEFEISKLHINEILWHKDRILDIGWWPGKYAFHYASLGHQITLVDLSPENIAFAKKKQNELWIFLDDIKVWNALSLKEFADESFDVLFCMGPLYHLTHEADRNAVINECKRIVKKGWHIVFGFITIMAQMISVLKKHPEKIIEWENALIKGIEDWINDVVFDTWFTEAHFIDPLEIEWYISQHGLSVVKVAGAEWLACQSEYILKELPEEQLKKWIELTYKYSHYKSTLWANQHVLCIAKK